ncbi:MAG: hypothetical protein K8J09_21040 [Planctomycetes bacterium]|nr:hypothetical protein [Planctomycetota bacterium]
MSLFLDNDVLAKLASWDLLEDGIQAFGFALADVRYLPTAPFWLGLAGKKKCSYPPEVQGRLRAFLAAAQACAEDPAGEDSELHKVDNIDAGEAILLSQAACSTGSFLATGDKRCIRAVANAPACERLVSLLGGRVLCLEQVLLRAIELLGFEAVKKRIVGSNQLAMDTAVRAAFGSGMQADAINACGSLERRVKSLASEAAGMLAPHEYRYGDEPTDP